MINNLIDVVANISNEEFIFNIVMIVASILSIRYIKRNFHNRG